MRNKNIMIILIFFLLIFVHHQEDVFSQTVTLTLEINEPLTDGKTIGIRNGGVFTSQGWKTRELTDFIQYNIVTCPAGQIEFDFQGIGASNDVFPLYIKDANGNTIENSVHYSIFNMWDRDEQELWWGKSPKGIRQWHNPWKCVIHLYGYTPGDRWKWRHGKLRLNVCAFEGGYDDDPHAFEDPAWGPIDWAIDHVYHFKLVWGEGRMQLFIDNVLQREWDYSSFGCEYAPPQHSIRIGSGIDVNNRTGAYQVPLNVTYSNFKFYRFTDVTPPRVVDFDPKDDGQGVSVDSDIIVFFSEPMDTVATKSAFSITPPVAGQIKWVGNSLYLKRAGLLQPSTTYTVRVSTAAIDRAGLPLEEAFVRQFRTISNVPAVVKKYDIFEVPLVATGLGNRNKYTQVSLKGTFQGPTATITIDGFWDGDDVWKVRMTPTEVGRWSYQITSSEPTLNASGSFECIDSDAKGFIRVNPTRPHTFMYEDGTPWPWIGDTAWRGYISVISYDGRWKQLVDLRAQQGFTAIQSIVVSYIRGAAFWSNEGGPCFAFSGDIKDYDQLNPFYFRWIDKRIEYALSKGIVPVMFFTWAQEYVKFSDRQFERFLRYLVSRYAAYNVVWIICGEYTEVPVDFPGRSTSEFDYWGRLIKQIDPYNHLVSLHPSGRKSSREFGDRPWMDFISHQHYLASEITADRIYNKPVVNLEPPYFYPPEEGGPSEDHRKILWEIITAGGFYTSGFYTTYAPDKGGWDLDALAEEQQWVSFLNKFIDRIPLSEMEPHHEWTLTGQLIAKPGEEYLAYHRNGGEVTIDLTHLTKALPVEWINPRACTIQPTGMVSGGAKRTFTPPFAGDWALHIGSGVKLDSIPPNAPISIVSPNQTMNSITLSWQSPPAAEDGDIAKYYLIIRQGTPLGTVTTTSYIDNGLEEATTYSYEVYAIDDAGLKSLQPAKITVTTKGDDQPPSVTSVQVVSASEIRVNFSEKVEPTSAQNTANYQITPTVQIVAATLAEDGTAVTLKTAAHTPGQSYSLQIANIKDRAKKSNIMPTPQTITYIVEDKLQISELNPASYRVADLTVNNKYYLDRDYVLRQIPEICQGYTWIMTQNDDKTRTDAHWLSFKVNLPAVVMVGYDSSTPLPGWLQSWKNTQQKIVTTDDAPLQLYQKEFPAGKVILGANEGNNKSSMYVVLVKKAQDSVVDTTPPQVPQGFRFGD